MKALLRWSYENLEWEHKWWWNSSTYVHSIPSRWTGFVNAFESGVERYWSALASATTFKAARCFIARPVQEEFNIQNDTSSSANGIETYLSAGHPCRSCWRADWQSKHCRLEWFSLPSGAHLNNEYCTLTSLNKTWKITSAMPILWTNSLGISSVAINECARFRSSSRAAGSCWDHFLPAVASASSKADVSAMEAVIGRNPRYDRNGLLFSYYVDWRTVRKRGHELVLTEGREPWTVQSHMQG